MQPALAPRIAFQDSVVPADPQSTDPDPDRGTEDLIQPPRDVESQARAGARGVGGSQEPSQPSLRLLIRRATLDFFLLAFLYILLWFLGGVAYEEPTWEYVHGCWQPGTVRLDSEHRLWRQFLLLAVILHLCLFLCRSLWSCCTPLGLLVTGYFLWRLLSGVFHGLSCKTDCETQGPSDVWELCVMSGPPVARLIALVLLLCWVGNRVTTLKTVVCSVLSVIASFSMLFVLGAADFSCTKIHQSQLFFAAHVVGACSTCLDVGCVICSLAVIVSTKIETKFWKVWIESMAWLPALLVGLSGGLSLLFRTGKLAVTFTCLFLDFAICALAIPGLDTVPAVFKAAVREVRGVGPHFPPLDPEGKVEDPKFEDGMKTLPPGYKPTPRRAVMVGISVYDEKGCLEGVKKDVARSREVLERLGFTLTVLDGNGTGRVTKDDLSFGLGTWVAAVKEDAKHFDEPVALVLAACHGQAAEGNTHDVELLPSDLSKGFNVAYLLASLNRVTVKKEESRKRGDLVTIVILDTCREGKDVTYRGRGGRDGQRPVPDLRKACVLNNFHIVYACDPGGEAADFSDGGVLVSKVMDLIEYKDSVCLLLRHAAKQARTRCQRAWYEERPGRDVVLGTIEMPTKVKAAVHCTYLTETQASAAVTAPSSDQRSHPEASDATTTSSHQQSHPKVSDSTSTSSHQQGYPEAPHVSTASSSHQQSYPEA